jgi:sugar/nucleoside kinase (ribokinase family)
MTQRFDVVGLGLCVYDVTVECSPYPLVDTKVDAQAVWHGGGGPVPNALAALARWGVSCAYVGRVGDDLWGRALRDRFVHAGVDVTHLQLDPECRTPIASIWVEAGTGRRTAVLGSDNVSETTQITAGLMENAGVLHMDARHVKTSVEAAGRARKSGVPVCLDVGSPRAGGIEVLDEVNHLVVAERFATFAAGHTDPVALLDALWRDTYEAVVITRGASGSLGRDASETQIEHGIYEVEVVDTTGAGDVYHAGYIYGLLEGWQLARRMEFASAAAALAATGLGARGYLPDRSEVESLIRNARPISG